MHLGDRQGEGGAGGRSGGGGGSGGGSGIGGGGGGGGSGGGGSLPHSVGESEVIESEETASDGSFPATELG
jgi:hypothetical protein